MTDRKIHRRAIDVAVVTPSKWRDLRELIRWTGFVVATINALFVNTLLSVTATTVKRVKSKLSQTYLKVVNQKKKKL
jgi:hypothetical protein